MMPKKTGICRLDPLDGPYNRLIAKSAATCAKVHGKLLACVRANRSIEPDLIVVPVDFDDHAKLLGAAPDI